MIYVMTLWNSFEFIKATTNPELFLCWLSDEYMSVRIEDIEEETGEPVGVACMLRMSQGWEHNIKEWWMGS